DMRGLWWIKFELRSSNFEVRRQNSGMFRFATLTIVAAAVMAQAPLPDTLDRTAAKWVDDTLKKMTLDEKIGQLIVPALNSTYLASDADEYEALVRKVTDLHVGGFHVFGGAELAPDVLLDRNYGTVILGQPMA